jgi:hypothetical protein
LLLVVNLEKPKELIKEHSPQSFGSFTSSCIKSVRFYEKFQRPKTEIYFKNLSNTLSQRSFDSEIFQKARAVLKKRNQINNYLLLILFFNKKSNTQFVRTNKG